MHLHYLHVHEYMLYMCMLYILFAHFHHGNCLLPCCQSIWS